MNLTGLMVMLGVFTILIAGVGVVVLFDVVDVRVELISDANFKETIKAPEPDTWYSKLGQTVLGAFKSSDDFLEDESAEKVCVNSTVTNKTTCYRITDADKTFYAFQVATEGDVIFTAVFTIVSLFLTMLGIVTIVLLVRGTS